MRIRRGGRPPHRKRVSMKIKLSFLAILVMAIATHAAELPRVYLQTTAPAVTGKSVSVTVDQLQAAISSARPGDEIVVQPGHLVGRLEFKNTPSGEGWITIRSANSG